MFLQVSYAEAAVRKHGGSMFLPPRSSWAGFLHQWEFDTGRVFELKFVLTSFEVKRLLSLNLNS